MVPPANSFQGWVGGNQGLHQCLMTRVTDREPGLSEMKMLGVTQLVNKNHILCHPVSYPPDVFKSLEIPA